MAPAYPFFVTPCLEAFGFLESRYGFAHEVEQLGRECFVRYRKGNRWVSIAYEPGSVPIVELFHPSHDMEHRRIPRLDIGMRRPQLFTEEETQMWQTLHAQATDLEAKEREFLSAK
jgi:hypothetical protein